MEPEMFKSSGHHFGSGGMENDEEWKGNGAIILILVATATTQE